MSKSLSIKFAIIFSFLSGSASVTAHTVESGEQISCEDEYNRLMNACNSQWYAAVESCWAAHDPKRLKYDDEFLPYYHLNLPCITNIAEPQYEACIAAASFFKDECEGGWTGTPGD